MLRQEPLDQRGVDIVGYTSRAPEPLAEVLDGLHVDLDHGRCVSATSQVLYESDELPLQWTAREATVNAPAAKVAIEHGTSSPRGTRRGDQPPLCAGQPMEPCFPAAVPRLRPPSRRPLRITGNCA